MNYAHAAGQMVTGALDSYGHFFPLDSFSQHFNYDTNGKLTSIVASNAPYTWTQTYTYANGVLTDISGWVRA